MSEIPSNPQTFFTQYVPERLRGLASHLAGRSSPGSMLFRVGDEEFGYRLTDGQLVLTRSMDDDVLVQVTIQPEVFEPVIVRAARAHESIQNPEQQLLALRALFVDPERAAMIRQVSGTAALVITEAERRHVVLLTPGAAKPNAESPECTLECSMADFMDMQTGKQHPLQLAFAGKIRMLGNAQIAMVLSGVLS